MVKGGLQEVAVSKVAQARDNVVVAIETFVDPSGDLCDQLADCWKRPPVVACQILATYDRRNEIRTMRSLGNCLQTVLVPSGEAICASAGRAFGKGTPRDSFSQRFSMRSYHP